MTSLRSAAVLVAALSFGSYTYGSAGCHADDPPPGHNSTDPCDCTACEQSGGICTDGCYNGMGCESVECYTPTPPLQGEFSCDGLVNCKTDEICVILSTYGDGCSGRYCDTPWASCEGDLSCACIAASGAYEITSCMESGGGVTVAATFTYEEGFGGGF
jgi:hypothetical protein